MIYLFFLYRDFEEMKGLVRQLVASCDRYTYIGDEVSTINRDENDVITLAIYAENVDEYMAGTHFRFIDKPIEIDLLLRNKFIFANPIWFGRVVRDIVANIDGYCVYKTLWDKIIYEYNNIRIIKTEFTNYHLSIMTEKFDNVGVSFTLFDCSNGKIYVVALFGGTKEEVAKLRNDIQFLSISPMLLIKEYIDALR